MGRRYDQSMRTLRYGTEPRHEREDDEPDVRPLCPECKRRDHAKDCPSLRGGGV